MANKPAKIPGYSKFIEVSRTAARNLHLDLDAGMARALLQSNPDHLDALRVLGDTLTQRGVHDEALEVDLKIARLAPREPLSFYNLACSYSNLNRLDEAVQALEESVRLGYDDPAHLERDPDLKNLRRDPRYRKLLTRLAAGKA